MPELPDLVHDEILFGARIHPKTFCHRLPPPAIDTLFQSIRSTLDHAIAEIRRRGEPVDTKVRDFLSVRGKARQPCPVCGNLHFAGVLASKIA